MSPNSSEPHDDGGEDETTSIDQSVLVVAGGQAAPVLEDVEGALDDVASLVVLGVEVDRPAAVAAAASAVGGLVGGDRDDSGDLAGSQVLAKCTRGVRLIAAQRLRAGAGSAGAKPWNVQLGQQRQGRRAVAGLPGRDRDDQRTSETLDQAMRFGRQAAAGPADGVIVRFVPAAVRILVIR